MRLFLLARKILAHLALRSARWLALLPTRQEMGAAARKRIFESYNPPTGTSLTSRNDFRAVAETSLS